MGGMAIDSATKVATATTKAVTTTGNKVVDGTNKVIAVSATTNNPTSKAFKGMGFIFGGVSRGKKK
eukprot:14725259-Ditylum_brightwellii.AAC.1